MIRLILITGLVLSVTVTGQESRPAVPVTDEATQILQQELEHEIMAPCCYGGPVADHDSPEARQVRAEIAQLLAEGKTKQEILDIYVAAYGEQILARPPARGFNLLAYIMPPALLLVGGFLLIVFIKRIKIPIPSQAPSASATDNDRLLERIEREMQELDI